MAIRKAAKHIRYKCKRAAANTVNHFLVVCLQFVRALAVGDVHKATMLQNSYVVLATVDLDGPWKQPKAYVEIVDHAVQLMNTSVQQRVKELQRIRAELPEHIYEPRTRSILQTLKRLSPGGCVVVAAVWDIDGNL